MTNFETKGLTIAIAILILGIVILFLFRKAYKEIKKDYITRMTLYYLDRLEDELGCLPDISQSRYLNRVIKHEFDKGGSYQANEAAKKVVNQISQIEKGRNYER